MYDFHKAKGQSGKVFHHPNFQRDKRHLMKHIKRKAATSLVPDTVQSKSESITSQNVNELLDVLKKKHDELDERMVELEAKNKAYAEKYTHLVSECCRATERNTVLSKLINCLTSILAIQGEHARDLPSSDASTNTILSVTGRSESMKAAKKLLLDSLKALKFSTPELLGQPRQILETPVSTKMAIEEAKSSQEFPVNPLVLFERNNEFLGDARHQQEEQEYYGEKDYMEKDRLGNNILQ
eukprot:TRINITY_DN2081_c0_g1_i11.p1 TRINITY_DN2081_c0_g1~~TRINITY_DN2081_c0_g1_i11.p1  ORF type:complete len:240 (+),score=70.30 TRINITY_DN2081_c0_g1_i11:447-1166(+)